MELNDNVGPTIGCFFPGLSRRRHDEINRQRVTREHFFRNEVHRPAMTSAGLLTCVRRDEQRSTKHSSP